MFCPSCGARNPTGARACADCNKALPVVPTRAVRLDDASMTTPDAPAAPPPEPPRILKRPAPLAPPPANLDTVPRNRGGVGPDDPTLVRPRVQTAPPPVTLASRPAPFAELPATVALPPDERPARPVASEVPAAWEPATVAEVNAFDHQAPPEESLPSTMSPQSGAPKARGPVGAETFQPEVTAPETTAPEVPAPVLPPRSRPPTTPPPSGPATPMHVSQPPPPPAALAARTAAPSGGTGAPLRSPPTPTQSASATDVGAPSQREPAASARPTTSAHATAAARRRVEVASAPRLWAAAVVDTVVGGACAAGGLVAVLAARGVRVAWQPVVDLLHADPMAAVGLIGAPVLAVALYHAVLVVALAGTLGHRLLGLRVRDASGERPGVARALVRGVGTALGVALFAIGPSWAWFIDRRRRGLGDLVARTVVTREARKAP